MKKCPDCGGDFENGVILDSTYGATLVQRYAKSGNVPSGTKNYIIGTNEANFTDLRRVVAYRCLKCNRIFQYAQDSIVLKDLNRRTKRIWMVFFLIIVAILIAVASVFIGSGILGIQ